MFNFKYSKKYSIASKVNKNEYAVYRHWLHSIIEYRNWQRRRYVDTTENYHVFLKRIGFAEDSLYISKLKQVQKRNQVRIDSLEKEYIFLKKSVKMLY